MISARGVLLWIGAWLLLDLMLCTAWCWWSPTARRRRRAKRALQRCLQLRDEQPAPPPPAEPERLIGGGRYA